MIKKRRTLLTALSSLFLTLSLSFAQPLLANQQYPTHAVKVIVPLSAGGGADTVARLISRQLSERLKQPFIVENKPGASGAIGSNQVALAPKDGHTLLVGFTTLAQLPALNVDMQFNPETDLIPISVIGKSVNLLIVNTEHKQKSVAELVTDLKANPDEFSYGSYGLGSTGHFLGEQFRLQSHNDLIHIPYKGAAPMMTELLSGQISFAFPDIGSARPHLASDRIRVLAAATNERVSFLPDVPTMDELGFKDFELEGWFVLFAPAGTPKPVVDQLSDHVQAIMQMPDIQQRFIDLGLIPVGSTQTAAVSFMDEEMKKWAAVAKKADMKLE